MYREMFEKLLRDSNRGKSPDTHYIVVSNAILEGLSLELLALRQDHYNNIPIDVRLEIPAPEDDHKEVVKYLFGYALQIDDTCTEPYFLGKTQAIGIDPLPFDEIPLPTPTPSSPDDFDEGMIEMLHNAIRTGDFDLVGKMNKSSSSVPKQKPDGSRVGTNP